MEARFLRLLALMARAAGRPAPPAPAAGGRAAATAAGGGAGGDGDLHEMWGYRTVGPPRAGDAGRPRTARSNAATVAGAGGGLDIESATMVLTLVAELLKVLAGARVDACHGRHMLSVPCVAAGDV